MEKLLTAQELSDYLKVKLSTIRKWCHYGYVPCLRIGEGLLGLKREKLNNGFTTKQEKEEINAKLAINCNTLTMKWLRTVLKNTNLY